MNNQLSDNRYLAGDDYTIADMSTWPWVRIYEWSGVDMSGLDHLARWMNDIAERPAAQKGIVTPPQSDLSEEELAEQLRKMVTK